MTTAKKKKMVKGIPVKSIPAFLVRKDMRIMNQTKNLSTGKGTERVVPIA